MQVNGSPTDAAAGLIKKGIHEGLATAATRRWPNTTRPNGRRRRRSNGSAARSPASARRSSAWSPPTTAPAAARSRRSRRPASTRCRRSPATTRRSRPAADHLRRPVQHHLQAERDRRAAAADVAVALLDGPDAEGETTLFNTPTQLFTPAVVTAENLKAEIIDKKIETARSSAPAAMPTAARSSASALTRPAGRQPAGPREPNAPAPLVSRNRRSRSIDRSHPDAANDGTRRTPARPSVLSACAASPSTSAPSPR